MSELVSPAALVCKRLEQLRAGARTLVLPRDLRGQQLRDGEHILGIDWERRPNPREDALALLERVEGAVCSLVSGLAVAAVVEGVCRVVEGGQRFGKKTTCVVVHVIATGEPARVVLVPVEAP